MARIRSIKPEYWADFETATNLSRDARLLYIALWNFCDEWSRMAGDARYVKGHCLPYDDDLDSDAIDALVNELAGVGNVVRYNAGGAPYLWLPNLAKHQRLEPHKVPSRLPEPPDHDPSGFRADESARDSDETGTNVALQVAGSRGQVASSRQQSRALPLPGELEILKSKLDARKLTARWDTLTSDAITEMVALVALHGDGPLIKASLAAYQPNDPIAFAQGWLGQWRAIPHPGQVLRVVVDTCSIHPAQGDSAGSCRACASDRLAGDA